MPKGRRKTIKPVEEVVQEAPVVVETPETEPELAPNPNVKVVEISGRKYNQIFNPADGTTHVEPLVD